MQDLNPDWDAFPQLQQTFTQVHADTSRKEARRLARILVKRPVEAWTVNYTAVLVLDSRADEARQILASLEGR